MGKEACIRHNGEISQSDLTLLPLALLRACVCQVLAPRERKGRIRWNLCRTSSLRKGPDTRHSSHGA